MVLGLLQPFLAPCAHRRKHAPTHSPLSRRAQPTAHRHVALCDAGAVWWPRSYMAGSYDAIALRWAPPNRKAWARADDAVAYNTLADMDAGVPLSTPLLLLRGNEQMRTLW